MKKIALSGSRAKLKILNGKTKEGFQLLKSTAQKFKSFTTGLADRIPQALAGRISFDLFSHLEAKSSKRLGIPKGIVLGGVLALMASLPTVGQVVTSTADAGAGTLREAITNANGTGADEVIFLAQGATYTILNNLPTIANNGTLQIICTGTINAIIDGAGTNRPFTMAIGSDLTLSKITVQNGFVANGNGGAIYNNRGDLTISNSIITNNAVTGGSPDGRGGGIYSKGDNVNAASASVLIQNSTISLNSSSRNGAGIFNYQKSLLTIISSSSILGNTSNSQGGGIYNHSSTNLTISSSSISGNTSNSQGGGIFNYASDNLTISSSSISGNTSSSQGGGLYNRSSDNLTISSSSISGNTSSSQGGGIFNHSSDNLTISSSSISGNTSDFHGGGIYNSSSTNLTISSSSISGNTSDNRGGGIYNHSSTNLTISSSSISGNTSDNRGGGIFNGSSDNLTISNSSISGNTSSGQGGGIYNGSSDNLTISNSSISGNMNSNRGGGIFNRFSDMTIQGSSVTLNSTTNRGGGIYITSNGTDAVGILNTTISSNEASVSVDGGGGIYAKSLGAGNTLILQHVTISNNSGTVTGGFTNNATSTMDITLQNSIIANSTGADFSQGTAVINGFSASNIVETGLVHASVIPVNPLLGALTLNSGFLVHPLQTSSSAIGAGANIGISTDQIGNTRVLANPTIGAVEITEVSGACMVLVAPAGVTNTWIGCTNSDWNTASNWSSGTVPTASDVIYVPIVAANQLIIDEVATCAKLVVQIGTKCLVNYNAGGRLQVSF